jgi:hypothetical protein
LRVVRVNSTSPSLSSTNLTAWLTADGLMLSAPAAVESIRAHSNQLLEDLADWEAVALDTAFDTRTA